MIENNTISKVAGYFFDKPTETIHLRELSRVLRISMPSILSSINKLLNLKIIKKEKKGNLTLIQANRDEKAYVRRKKIYNLESVLESGIVESLISNYNQPTAIVLFGSYCKGEDVERSDIDIAVLTHKKKKIDLSSFEKKLGRSVSLHEVHLSKISKEFKQSLDNGIVLEGFL